MLSDGEGMGMVEGRSEQGVTVGWLFLLTNPPFELDRERTSNRKPILPPDLAESSDIKKEK